MAAKSLMDLTGRVAVVIGGTSGIGRKLVAGLATAGATVVPFYVVTAGQIDMIRPTMLGDELVARHGPGQFSGETNMLSGRRSLVRAQVSADGEAIEMSREAMLAQRVLQVRHFAQAHVAVAELHRHVAIAQ